MKLDEKALDAARYAFALEGSHDESSWLAAAIRAYLSALPSSPVSELVEQLRETHTCDGCGEYVGSIIHDLCDEAASTLTTLSTRNAELEREVKRLREAQRWQPIETAPKDGSWIHLWRGSTEFGRWSPLVTARWHEFEDGDEGWVWPDGPFDPYTEEGRAEADELITLGDYFESTEFSHWRSLSTPPQGGEHE